MVLDMSIISVDAGYIPRYRSLHRPTVMWPSLPRGASPDLVLFLLQHAAPHLKAQIAVEWSTGARVSSILHGCRLCDVILATGREQITFHDTKNGEPVTAALHPFAAKAVAEYLQIRGKLEKREEPLFLADDGKPYKPGRGTQNRTAFDGMKRRAVKRLRFAIVAGGLLGEVGDAQLACTGGPGGGSVRSAARR